MAVSARAPAPWGFCCHGTSPRFPLTGLPLHVVQRGNDRKPCFFLATDYRVYLDALQAASRHHHLRIHAYVLMTNHVHLLVTPDVSGALPRMMQSLGARYVSYINRRHGRSGTLWEGRYKACLVETDRHVAAVCRYVDLNPVRAGIVEHPVRYRWSSYAALAGLRIDPVVEPHKSLAALGVPPGERYARWCAQPAADGEIEEVRRAVAGELALGSDSFKARIEQATARATRRRLPGPRPRRRASAPASVASPRADDDQELQL
jgi:putative transposase